MYRRHVSRSLSPGTVMTPSGMAAGAKKKIFHWFILVYVHVFTSFHLRPNDQFRMWICAGINTEFTKFWHETNWNLMTRPSSLILGPVFPSRILQLKHQFLWERKENQNLWCAVVHSWEFMVHLGNLVFLKYSISIIMNPNKNRDKAKTINIFFQLYELLLHFVGMQTSVFLPSQVCLSC